MLQPSFSLFSTSPHANGMGIRSTSTHLLGPATYGISRTSVTSSSSAGGGTTLGAPYAPVQLLRSLGVEEKDSASNSLSYSTPVGVDLFLKEVGGKGPFSSAPMLPTESSKSNDAGGGFTVLADVEKTMVSSPNAAVAAVTAAAAAGGGTAAASGPSGTTRGGGRSSSRRSLNPKPNGGSGGRSNLSLSNHPTGYHRNRPDSHPPHLENDGGLEAGGLFNHSTGLSSGASNPVAPQQRKTREMGERRGTGATPPSSLSTASMSPFTTSTTTTGEGVGSAVHTAGVPPSGAEGLTFTGPQNAVFPSSSSPHLHPNGPGSGNRSPPGGGGGVPSTRDRRLHLDFKALTKSERQRVVQREAADSDLLERTVHLRFLPTSMKQGELAAMCRECGPYLRIRICGNSTDNQNWIYGFVEFETREGALNLMRMNGREMPNGEGRSVLRLKCHTANQPIVDRVFHDADPASNSPCIFGQGNFEHRTLKDALDSYFNLKAKEQRGQQGVHPPPPLSSSTTMGTGVGGHGGGWANSPLTGMESSSCVTTRTNSGTTTMATTPTTTTHTPKSDFNGFSVVAGGVDNFAEGGGVVTGPSSLETGMLPNTGGLSAGGDGGRLTTSTSGAVTPCGTAASFGTAVASPDFVFFPLSTPSNEENAYTHTPPNLAHGSAGEGVSARGGGDPATLFCGTSRTGTPLPSGVGGTRGSQLRATAQAFIPPFTVSSVAAGPSNTCPTPPTTVGSVLPTHHGPLDLIGGGNGYPRQKSGSMSSGEAGGDYPPSFSVSSSPSPPLHSVADSEHSMGMMGGATGFPPGNGIPYVTTLPPSSATFSSAGAGVLLPPPAYDSLTSTPIPLSSSSFILDGVMPSHLMHDGNPFSVNPFPGNHSSERHRMMEAGEVELGLALSTEPTADSTGTHVPTTSSPLSSSSLPSDASSPFSSPPLLPFSCQELSPLLSMDAGVSSALLESLTSIRVSGPPTVGNLAGEVEERSALHESPSPRSAHGTPPPVLKEDQGNEEAAQDSTTAVGGTLPMTSSVPSSLSLISSPSHLLTLDTPATPLFSDPWSSTNASIDVASLLSSTAFATMTTAVRHTAEDAVKGGVSLPCTHPTAPLSSFYSPMEEVDARLSRTLESMISNNLLAMSGEDVVKHCATLLRCAFQQGNLYMTSNQHFLDTMKTLQGLLEKLDMYEALTGCAADTAAGDLTSELPQKATQLRLLSNLMVSLLFLAKRSIRDALPYTNALIRCVMDIPLKPLAPPPSAVFPLEKGVPTSVSSLSYHGSATGSSVWWIGNTNMEEVVSEDENHLPLSQHAPSGEKEEDERDADDRDGIRLRDGKQSSSSSQEEVKRKREKREEEYHYDSFPYSLSPYSGEAFSVSSLVENVVSAETKTREEEEESEKKDSHLSSFGKQQHHTSRQGKREGAPAQKENCRNEDDDDDAELWKEKKSEGDEDMKKTSFSSVPPSQQRSEGEDGKQRGQGRENEVDEGDGRKKKGVFIAKDPTSQFYARDLQFHRYVLQVLLCAGIAVEEVVPELAATIFQSALHRAEKVLSRRSEVVHRCATGMLAFASATANNQSGGATVEPSTVNHVEMKGSTPHPVAPSAVTLMSWASPSSGLRKWQRRGYPRLGDEVMHTTPHRAKRLTSPPPPIPPLCNQHSAIHSPIGVPQEEGGCQGGEGPIVKGSGEVENACTTCCCVVSGRADPTPEERKSAGVFPTGSASEQGGQQPCSGNVTPAAPLTRDLTAFPRFFFQHASGCQLLLTLPVEKDEFWESLPPMHFMNFF